MASLFKIEADLLELFQAIEDAGGEITEEQEAYLSIKQDELESKMDNYRKYIGSLESHVAECADEKKRIDSFKKTKENLIKRLKNSMLNGVKMFGDKTKTGGFNLSFTTFKLFTRKTKVVETDEGRIDILSKELDRFLRELTQAGVVYSAMDVDLSGILASINANVKAELGDMFKPFTLSDLTAVKVKISSTYTIYNLFQHGEHAINQLASNDESIMLETATTKDDWKLAIYNAEMQKYDAPTVAKIVESDSLIIK